jgi:two-component system NtrC family sensor kinase
MVSAWPPRWRPVRPFCHVGHINQVFLTLLTNAFEAISGAGTVTLSTEADSENVFVRIADTGRGIPRDRRGDIFTAHFAAKQSRMSAAFGLAASRSIVHQHGGEICVESSSARGTTFLVTLPLNLAQPP